MIDEIIISGTVAKFDDIQATYTFDKYQPYRTYKDYKLHIQILNDYKRNMFINYIKENKTLYVKYTSGTYGIIFLHKYFYNYGRTLVFTKCASSSIKKEQYLTKLREYNIKTILL